MTSEVASAAASGANATARFQNDKSPYEAVKDVPKERVDKLARRVLEAVHATIREENVTYAEYNALKAWLIQVGLDGEWPLFLDVWVEHVVEEVATSDRQGNKGTIEGPYYVPDSPVISDEKGVGTVPTREGEGGTPLTWTGTVTAVDGTALSDAKVEIWHADDDGFYSQFAPNLPEWNLRGTNHVGPDGSFEIHTVQPAPYQIPTDGACGALIGAAGWHAWRPAHIHVKVSAPGYQLLTAQLYFPGDAHNDDDIASAVKPELLLDPQQQADGSATVAYSFVLDPEA
ncbi:catechol 1,2-dioxygenase [Streptomyces brasiliensis]|uniref:Catechol 1,2-dioxygenase n=1 Tax=Streptomyces brasiliensis TaxID=1954 RepID=A0A917P204_9ACTN|nr:catechol 1,2-dioxygenase [Streptomyces brasiliensis]GGJ52918.1 catechol 1,2-dioxygenase [Streptomyces brasiliensis]